MKADRNWFARGSHKGLLWERGLQGGPSPFVFFCGVWGPPKGPL